MKPVLLAPPPGPPWPPVKPMTLSTAGSAWITFSTSSNRVAHGLKGGVLRALQPALDAARVLQGEKALGYAANQNDVQG